MHLTSFNMSLTSLKSSAWAAPLSKSGADPDRSCSRGCSETSRDAPAAALAAPGPSHPKSPRNALKSHLNYSKAFNDIYYIMNYVLE